MQAARQFQFEMLAVPAFSNNFKGERWGLIDMPSDEAFDEFAARLKRGESAAYADLSARYLQRLRALAARRLPPLLRSKFDADDVMQSVLRNFIAGLQRGTTALDSSVSMKGLLALMVKRKCAKYIESYTAGKRDVRRETNLYEPMQPLHCLDRESTPEENAELADSLMHWLSGFDQQDQQVVMAILNGESTSSIASRLGTSQRTIQRTVRRMIQQSGLLLET